MQLPSVPDKYDPAHIYALLTLTAHPAPFPYSAVANANTPNQTMLYFVIGDQIRCLVAAQHAVDQIPERSPKILPTSKVVFVNEQHVLFEARVKVRL